MNVLTATTSPSLKTTVFPTTSVEAALRSELIEAVRMEASIKNIELPNLDKDICKLAIQVDSLIVVAILCSIEQILGGELPNSVVRAGGYQSVESAIEHLMPGLKNFWLKSEGKPI
jgi:hypothetical protein